MSIAQLDVYNEALALLGERQLSIITEQREPRRVLDLIWPFVTAGCLRCGIWNFCLKNAALSSSGGANFGLSSSFTKPSDFILLQRASLSSSFDPPLVNDFADLGGSFYANGSTLYVNYTSNDPSAGGMNVALWTPNFLLYVAAALAAWASRRIQGIHDPNLMVIEERRLLTALATDAVTGINGMLPFNAPARDEVAQNSPTRADALLPFAELVLGARQAPAPQLPAPRLPGNR
jgi:hypothetical protein